MNNVSQWLLAVGGSAALAVLMTTRAVAVDISDQRSASGVSIVSAGDRALYEAAQEGALATLDALLAGGANANAAIDGDGSPLIAAARNGRIDAVTLLLERGADPDLIVRGDGSPLIMAAREGHVDVVELLLDRGAVVDQVAPDDENALIQASSHGKLGAVQLLVERGADVNARLWAETMSLRGQTERGEWRTPLSMARRGHHEEVAAYLVSAGARE